MTAAGGAIASTCTLDEAGAWEWDVVIVGAGPAGASAAISLAREGVAVLLLDRSVFPRWKVCGCCLNAGAVDVLGAIGLGDVVTGLGARRLDTLDLAAGSARARVAVRGSVALSREALDSALLRTALTSGAHFIGGCVVEAADVFTGMLPVRGGAGARAHVRARVILAADGVAAALAPELAAVRSRTTRIGLGATFEADPAGLVSPDDISMSVTRHGYVGAVILEDGRLNIAAAVSPRALRRAGSPHAMVADILTSCRRRIPDALASARFRGTPALTFRRTRVAAGRLLVLGDSAGYVEPFTGEGIAWGLRCGLVAAGVAHDMTAGRADATAWERWWVNHMRPSHRRCGLLVRVLRAGPLLPLGVRAVAAVPYLGDWIADSLSSRPTVATA